MRGARGRLMASIWTSLAARTTQACLMIVSCMSHARQRHACTSDACLLHSKSIGIPSGLLYLLSSDALGGSLIGSCAEEVVWCRLLQVPGWLWHSVHERAAVLRGARCKGEKSALRKVHAGSATAMQRMLTANQWASSRDTRSLVSPRCRATRHRCVLD